MLKVLLSALALGALFLPAVARAQGNYIFVTDFPKNGNIQSNLIAQFPTGLWVATNSFATPFDVVTNAAGENFYAANTTLSNNISIPAVSNVYTLINAYAPGGGAVATIEFKGDQGADQTFTLNGGVNIRDFYQGSFVNTLNNTTTENAFEAFDVQGGGATGNVNTGLTGNYVIDEQSFSLDAAFLTQHLTEIILSGTGNGTPIILGITAQVATPVITGITQSSNNLTIQASGGFAGATYLTLTSTNLPLPLNQWIAIETNILTAGGSFSVTLTNAHNPATPQQFFTIEMQ
jgi:hypothetical protein